MAILDVSELSTYAPSVTSGSVVDILVAQAAIEAWLGFPVEQSERVEILQLTSRSKRAQLSYHPVSTTPNPVIEIRQGGSRDRLDRQPETTDWISVEANDYVLDATGLISLSTSISFARLGFACINATELRATYTAGLDFTQNNPEINALKAATGQIITYQSSRRFKSGVSEVEVKNQFRQKWSAGTSNSSGSSAAGSTPESFFLPFQKYKPRSVILAG